MTDKDSIAKIAARFPGLDFPGRTTLYAHEVAAKLGCSEKHVFDLIDEGRLDALDLTGSGNRTGRRALRVPREAWLRFLAAADTARNPDRN
jgi:hypothetical protein